MRAHFIYAGYGSHQSDHEVAAYAALAVSLQGGFEPNYDYIDLESPQHEENESYLTGDLAYAASSCFGGVSDMLLGNNVTFEYLQFEGFPVPPGEDGYPKDGGEGKVDRAIIEKITPQLTSWVLGTGDPMSEYPSKIQEIREWLDR